MSLDERREAGEDGLGDGRMTLQEHLRELRSRLIKALVAVALGAVAGFLLYDWILDLLIQPYCDVLPADRECTLLITDPLAGFSIRMKLSGYSGLLLASPVVFWQLWRFITPGLYPREKRFAVPFVAASVLLFVLGAGLALYTIPNALQFLVSIGGSQFEIFYEPNRYLSLVTLMMVAFGAGFEFPILLVFLQMAGILEPSTLARWRRGAVVVIFALVAVITPSGDPISLLALAVPMVLFYEGSILIGRLLRRR
jgi:sec-independent protein translocase protein TatC